MTEKNDEVIIISKKIDGHEVSAKYPMNEEIFKIVSEEFHSTIERINERLGWNNTNTD